MSFDSARLWGLLPPHLRERDTAAANPDGPDRQGRWRKGPLRELVDILAEQTGVLEEELDQLYDNHFVETAAPWALPYLADLLGIRGVGGTGHSPRLAPRAEVANTLAYRRRKGTAAVLEQLARDATGHPAAVVEYFQRLAATQHVNHARPAAKAWADLRNARTLELTGTPFETAARTVEVRRIRPGLGKWNVPNVGVFLWRLDAHSRTRSPLAPAREIPDDCHFRFHPLGLDLPLCLKPRAEEEIEHLAVPENTPMLITRRLLAGEPLKENPLQFHPRADLYGPEDEKSLCLEVGGAAVAVEDLVVCHLGDVSNGTQRHWGHDTTPPARNGRKMILLDPVLGRVVFPDPPEQPRATFHFPFAADLGGGEYARVSSFDRDSPPTDRIPNASPGLPGRIAAALASVTDERSHTFEIVDSDRYVETQVQVSVPGKHTVEVRAADGAWPVVVAGKAWKISGGAGGRVTLNGLLLSGSETALDITGGLRRFDLRHCTLMRGLSRGKAGVVKTVAPGPAGIVVSGESTEIVIEDSLLGPLELPSLTRVWLRNCIVDAGAPDRAAIGGANGAMAGILHLENCTVIGRVAAREITLASNCIFKGTAVAAEKTQEGCVRFSWLPADARVPRRHRCLPCSEKTAGGDCGCGPGGAAGDCAASPAFVSLDLGHPGYGQLAVSCSAAIRQGADDGSEMGAYHDQYQPLREAHLRARVEEYLPFGLEAGIFYCEHHLPKRKGTP